MEHPDWEKTIHDPCLLTDAADKIDAAIRQIVPDAGAIVITGYSGAIVGAVVSALSNLPIIVIRKIDEKRHSQYSVQGMDFNGKYVIVDDLIDSGESIKRMISGMNNCGYSPEKCGGIFLYSFALFFQSIDLEFNKVTTDWKFNYGDVAIPVIPVNGVEY